ncbi:MAG TPA: rhomboid family intramembrane serine protease [Terracidiphilus sp.]
MPFAFPDFSGATRRLVLVNVGTFFALLLADLAFRSTGGAFAAHLQLIPSLFLRGELWQPLTYSFIHPSLIGTLFELLSLWFLASFLEMSRGDAWVMGLYAVSVLGTALAAVALFIVGQRMGLAINEMPLYGCMGGIFGMLIAIGVLHGDTQFLLFFAIGIKARYMAAIYALITFAMLFGQSRMYAFAQLGGALAGLIYIRFAPRRGVSFMVSEGWFGLRNQFYRWKRKRAGRKFEVYMRKQGRTVRFDGRGRQIDEDPEDKSRWN